MFEVVVDSGYERHNGLCRGLFGGVPRGNACACAHDGGGRGSNDGIGVQFAVVKIKQSLLDSTVATNVSMKV